MLPTLPRATFLNVDEYSYHCLCTLTSALITIGRAPRLHTIHGYMPGSTEPFPLLLLYEEMVLFRSFSVDNLSDFGWYYSAIDPWRSHSFGTDHTDRSSTWLFLDNIILIAYKLPLWPYYFLCVSKHVHFFSLSFKTYQKQLISNLMYK